MGIRFTIGLVFCASGTGTQKSNTSLFSGDTPIIYAPLAFTSIAFAKNFVFNIVVCNQHNARRSFLNQRNGSVFELSSCKTLCVAIRCFL